MVMPRRRKPPTVLGAKTRLDELKALRYVLAVRIDDERTSARDLAALCRQLREVSVEVEELSAAEAQASAHDVPESDEVFRLHMI